MKTTFPFVFAALLAIAPRAQGAPRMHVVHHNWTTQPGHHIALRIDPAPETSLHSFQAFRNWLNTPAGAPALELNAELEHLLSFENAVTSYEKRRSIASFDNHLSDELRKEMSIIATYGPEKAAEVAVAVNAALQKAKSEEIVPILTKINDAVLADSVRRLDLEEIHRFLSTMRYAGAPVAETLGYLESKLKIGPYAAGRDRLKEVQDAMVRPLEAARDAGIEEMLVGGTAKPREAAGAPAVAASEARGQTPSDPAVERARRLEPAPAGASGAAARWSDITPGQLIGMNLKELLLARRGPAAPQSSNSSPALDPKPIAADITPGQMIGRDLKAILAGRSSSEPPAPSSGGLPLKAILLVAAAILAAVAAWVLWDSAGAKAAALPFLLVGLAFQIDPDARDYYKVLGLDRTATTADIKAAYRQAVKEYYPENVREAKTREQLDLPHRRFTRINEAYATLIKPEKRRDYDAYGASSSEPAGSSAAGPDASHQPKWPDNRRTTFPPQFNPYTISAAQLAGYFRSRLKEPVTAQEYLEALSQPVSMLYDMENYYGVFRNRGYGAESRFSYARALLNEVYATLPRLTANHLTTSDMDELFSSIWLLNQFGPYEAERLPDEIASYIKRPRPKAEIQAELQAASLYRASGAGYRIQRYMGAWAGAWLDAYFAAQPDFQEAIAFYPTIADDWMRSWFFGKTLRLITSKADLRQAEAAARQREAGSEDYLDNGLPGIIRRVKDMRPDLYPARGLLNKILRKDVASR